MAGNFTFFTNDSGAAAGPTDYVRDVFDDVSLPANDNTGLTNTASTNPFGKYFANDDTARYQVKTLFIKDVILNPDRTKWINNKPTYQVIWHENFPAVTGYFYGNIQVAANLNQVSGDGQPFESDCTVVSIKTIGDGFGVNGVIRRVAFLVGGMRSATGTARVAVDGTNGNTIDFSNLSSASDDTSQTRYSAFVHAATNETNDLHDIRLKAIEADTLKIVGAVVLIENASATPHVLPGITYVDKSKITTTVGASFSVPSYGSSLGGMGLIYKTSSSGYALSALSATTCLSIAQGSSGTNLLTVSTGHGASFPQGSGVVVAQGTSMYVGSVLSVSTDTLTVSPTLTFGISNAIYRSWRSGSTLAISSTTHALAYSIDFTKALKNQHGVTGILDLKNNYAFWGKNYGATVIDGEVALSFFGASGFMQVDGYFSAAEMEFNGTGAFHATLSINGTPGWGANEGQTGPIRRTVFTSAAPGWNSFVFSPGASLSLNLGIQRINLYNRIPDPGITFGHLGHFPTHNAYTERAAINATMMSLGTARRLYADQLYLAGPWARGSTYTVPGNVVYYGSTTTCTMQAQYYGTNFALIGTAGGGTLAIDGVGTGLTFNAMKSVPTLGFHTVTYTTGSGATSQIHAFDFTNPYGEMTCDQTVHEDAPVSDDTPIHAIYAVGADVTNAFSDNSTFSIDYNFRIADTHHIVHTGAGVWNCQVPKKSLYDISASWTDSLAGGSVYNISVILVVNGVQIMAEIRSGTTAASVTTAGVGARWTYPLNAGDIVTIQAYGKENAAGSHTIIAGSPKTCIFSITERK